MMVSQPVEPRLRAGTVIQEDGCHVFTRNIDQQGYGRISVNGEKQLAHRVAHELFIGPIPNGFEVDHLCFNRACVNPAHLEAVTPLVNTMRSSAPSALNARKTHCDAGHPFSPENTRRRTDRRGRLCRACDRDRARAYRARRAA